MKMEQFTKRKPSLGFIIGCLIKYNFKTFKRFIIYIFHYLGFLNLSEKKSNEFSDKEIIDILTQIHPEKIEKKLLYALTNLSKTTFNKHFKEFFIKNNFKGKRKFTLYEVYVILKEWQGEGKWSVLESLNKNRIAEIISSGNYKKLASEFHLIDANYKNKNKFSPKEVKLFLKHIDLDNSEKEEELLHYKKSHIQTLWVFGILMIDKVLEKSTAYNNQHES